MPKYELWNLQTALECVDGYKNDLKDLTRIWLRQTPELLDQLRAGFNTGNITVVNRTAHTLRGSLDILGAARLSAVAEKLETMKTPEVTTSGVALLKELEALIEMLTPDIAEFTDAEDSD